MSPFSFRDAVLPAHRAASRTLCRAVGVGIAVPAAEVPGEVRATATGRGSACNGRRRSVPHRGECSRTPWNPRPSPLLLTHVPPSVRAGRRFVGAWNGPCPRHETPASSEPPISCWGPRSPPVPVLRPPQRKHLAMILGEPQPPGLASGLYAWDREDADVVENRGAPDSLYTARSSTPGETLRPGGARLDAQLRPEHQQAPRPSPTLRCSLNDSRSTPLRGTAGPTWTGLSRSARGPTVDGRSRVSAGVPHSSVIQQPWAGRPIACQYFGPGTRATPSGAPKEIRCPLP